MFSPLLLSLDCYSEEGGDQRHLSKNISLASSPHLSFAYHVHRLVSLEGSLCCPKGKEAHPGFRQPFEKPMILFDPVIEVLDLPQFTAFRDNPLGFELLQGFWIGGILVHVDHARGHRMSGSKRFAEKTLGRIAIPCLT